VIQKHYKKANIAAGVWIVSIVILVIVANKAEGNIWESGEILPIIAFLLYTVSLLAALWYYAKAKGYWGIFGCLLFLLSVFGLVILLLLPDRQKHQDNKGAA